MENKAVYLKNDIEKIVNKYRYLISQVLPKPHIDFVYSKKTSFVVHDFSDDYDAEVEWTYYYNTNNPGGYVLGYKTAIISLQNDVIPAIKKLIALPPKTKTPKRIDTLKNIADIALFLMGSDLSFSESLEEISDKSKEELTCIVRRYETKIDRYRKKLKEESKTSLWDLLQSSEQPIQYKGRPLAKDKNDNKVIWYGNPNDHYSVGIMIFFNSNDKPEDYFVFLQDNKTSKVIKSTASISGDDLQTLLDVADKWLEDAYKRCSEEQERKKRENSNNRGEKDVQYHIKWTLKSLDKYIVAIDNDCESQYRYNCILLKNASFIDEVQEYDHILVTSSGVILIETKDWKGNIDISSDGKWIRYNDENKPYGVASPISQMRRHEQLINSILPSVPVFNILCFSNPSAIVKGKENVKKYTIINIEQLEDVLTDLCSQQNFKYTNDDIDNIVKTIESYKVGKA